MDVHEIRDGDDARAFLMQGLWLQRAVQPSATTVRPALEWALEICGRGNLLPPIGFVADLGQASLGLDWEGRGTRVKTILPNVPPELLAAYEDHVLGRIYADWSFTLAGESLRRFRQGRDRARGLAYLVTQLGIRAGWSGVDLSPGIVSAMLSESADDILRQGWESLENDGLHPLLTLLYESLLTSTRRMAEILGPEDLLELQTGTALDEESVRLAFRQAATAAATFEAALPRNRVRPLPRRQEVPTRVLDEDTYPVGGFSSISNRGSIESILHSQLAYIEEHEPPPDLFDIKYVRDELLYYSRDENQFLRRRRTFVLIFHHDLQGVLHVKDVELRFQRGILLLGLVFVLIRKLSEWLSTDALVFDLVFVSPPGKPRVLPLQAEFDLLARLLREQAVTRSVMFNVLFLDPMPRSAAAEKDVDDLKRSLIERLPPGAAQFSNVDSLFAVEALCSQRARRSLCHCLAVSRVPFDLDPPDTVVTRFLLDGPAPAVGGDREKPAVPESPDAMSAWAETLKQLLQRWI